MNDKGMAVNLTPDIAQPATAGVVAKFPDLFKPDQVRAEVFGKHALPPVIGVGQTV